MLNRGDEEEAGDRGKSYNLHTDGGEKPKENQQKSTENLQKPKENLAQTLQRLTALDSKTLDSDFFPRVVVDFRRFFPQFPRFPLVLRIFPDSGQNLPVS